MTKASDEAKNEKAQVPPEETPQALVGSGSQKLHVKANTGVLNLRAGQEAFIEKTPEAEANIATGHLTELK